MATEHEGEYHARFLDDGVGGGDGAGGGSHRLGPLAREPDGFCDSPDLPLVERQVPRSAACKWFVGTVGRGGRRPLFVLPLAEGDGKMEVGGALAPPTRTK